MSTAVLFPKFTSVVFSPNPVNKGAKVVITVKVTEETRYLEAEVRYSGEFNAGEV